MFLDGERRAPYLSPVTDPTPAEIDWKARALTAEATNAARARLGRPPARPVTADARLVARACAALAIRRGALAERLGIAASSLSRANGPGLWPAHREALRALLREMAEASRAER